MSRVVNSFSFSVEWRWLNRPFHHPCCGWHRWRVLFKIWFHPKGRHTGILYMNVTISALACGSFVSRCDARVSQPRSCEQVHYIELRYFFLFEKCFVYLLLTNNNVYLRPENCPLPPPNVPKSK